MEKKVIIELTVEVESPDDRSVEEDIIGALSESLHHFDVVNYEEDPPVRPCWGKMLRNPKRRLLRLPYLRLHDELAAGNLPGVSHSAGNVGWKRQMSVEP